MPKKKSTKKLVQLKIKQTLFSRKIDILAFALVFCAVGLFVVLRSHAGAVSYRVTGNKIVDSAGQQVIVHGVDRPSLEWSCSGQSVNNGGSGIPASDFTTMQSKWNANAVRIALNQDFWLAGAAKHCSTYQATVNAAVQNARAAGLIVILDLHWSDQGNLANGSPGQQCMADQNSVPFWNQVAGTYKNDPGVWFELYNEPHDIDWNTWLNGGPLCGFQAVGMQSLYNAVRSSGATNIVVAGGREWASSLNNPPMISGTNIAYAVHIYRQSASWSPAGWDGQFGTFSSQAPVIATEFGDQVCDGQGFVQSLLNYIHAHNAGYTAWAWFAQSCAFTSIITDAAGDCAGASTGCVIQADMKSFTGTPLPTPAPTQSTPAPTSTTTPPTPAPSNTPKPTPTPPSPSATPKASPSPTPGPQSNAGAITGPAGKCLDNFHGQKTNGNKIDLYQCNQTSSQKWTRSISATGAVVNNNGYCLDVPHGAVKSGTIVQLYKCNGTVAQQWTINRATKTIVNPHSGMCLDDQWGRTGNGNPIWIYKCNGTASQKWTTP